jgi:AcrR family transcriptional regulator
MADLSKRRSLAKPVHMDQPVKRRRLDPQVRRDLILDEAARVALDEGVIAVNMERIGREAGVSKALVYNYFPTKNALLSELLIREYKTFQAEGRAAAEAATDFEELVRATTRSYLQHVAARGVLIQRLMNEPAVAQAIQSVDQQGRELTVAFFARAMTESFGIAPKLAATVTDLLMGLTGRAGDYLSRHRTDADFVETITVQMIMAAVRAVASDPPPVRAGSDRKASATS